MSRLRTEILEQPVAIERLLEYETDHVRRLVRETRGKFDYAVIAARGTSDNAARYAKYLWGAHNQLPVALATPSLFSLYKAPPRMNGALVVGISQSGQSPDIVSVIAEAHRQGRPTIAITNDTESPLAHTAEHVISLHAGPELAVAATKTYTASLAAIALISALLADDTGQMDQLCAIPGLMTQNLASLTPVLGKFERYRYMSRCAVIGRGYNYATAYEIALKIKELTQVDAQAYSSADFRHGPITMVRESLPVILLAPNGPVLEDLRALITDLKTLGAEQLIISDEAAVLAEAHLPLPLPPGLPESLSPLVAVLPGQLFAMTLAELKGLDPDQPVGLTKVTETL